MNLEVIEKKLYSNKEISDSLLIFREENWKKATPLERLDFFKCFVKFVNSIDGTMPKDVLVDNLISEIGQEILVDDYMIYMDKSFFHKKANPYNVMHYLIFELCIYSNINFAETEEAKNSEVGKRFIVNNSSSVFGDWDNFIGRKNDDFIFQPLTYEASKDARMFCYDLVKYMYKLYGMDNYSYSELQNLMINSFEKERAEKKVENNYKQMIENYNLLEDEHKKIVKVYEFLDDNDFSKLSDDDFYFLFNTKLIHNFNVEERGSLYAEFINRLLKNSTFKKDLISNISICEDDDGIIVKIAGNEYRANIYQELSLIAGSIFNVKIHEGILDEIEDEAFKIESMECLKYMSELQDENGNVMLKYNLNSAIPVQECKNFLYDYYYKKISHSIETNSIFNEGSPCLIKANFSKYDAYLNFNFNKTYAQIRAEQFATLKEEYEAKKGARR